MDQNPSLAPALPEPPTPSQDSVGDFFTDLGAKPVLPAPTSGSSSWRPGKAMLWYAAIADDLLANPGTSLKACAERLGRSPTTIRLIANSDLFRAYWETRRAQFNEDLQQKLITKLNRVADKALDLTLDVLDKKGDTIPLKMLHEITSGTLDRLGYSPSRSESAPAVQVNVQNNTSAAATQASPDAIARAREHMKVLASSRPPVVLDQPVAASEEEG